MTLSRTRIAIVVSLVAMLLSVPLHRSVAASVYIVIAVAVAVVFLRSSDRKSPYFAVAVAQIFFAVGWGLEVLAAEPDLAELAYTVAYLPVLVAVGRIMRRRVGRVEQEATAFAAPLLVAIATNASDSQRFGMATILLFVIAGFFLLWPVREPDRHH